MVGRRSQSLACPTLHETQLDGARLEFQSLADFRENGRLMPFRNKGWNYGNAAVWRPNSSGCIHARRRRIISWSTGLLVSGVPLAICECSLGDGLPSTSESRCGRSSDDSVKFRRSLTNFGARPRQFDLRSASIVYQYGKVRQPPLPSRIERRCRIPFCTLW